MIAADEFNPKRLALARMRRRMTGLALAKNTGLAADTIRRLEKGMHAPDNETVDRICLALQYPRDFFFVSEVHEIDTDAVSFRSFSKMSARERDAAIAAGVVGIELSNYVERAFELPKIDLIDLSDETNPSIAAASLRQYWRLGEHPIENLVALMETRGVRLFSLSENTASVNAFSFWRDDKPFVFLNNFKTAESSIFDAAHELGHLVMHKNADIRGSRSVEREANDFASSFLMPSNDLRSHLPRFITADDIIRLKTRWRVSAMALARRCYSIERLSEGQYKSICIELGRRDYRTNEPVTVGREKSIVWRKILTHLWTRKVTKADIAKALHLPLDELEGLIWGLTGETDVPPRGASPQIRVVS